MNLTKKFFPIPTHTHADNHVTAHTTSFFWRIAHTLLLASLLSVSTSFCAQQHYTQPEDISDVFSDLCQLYDTGFCSPSRTIVTLNCADGIVTAPQTMINRLSHPEAVANLTQYTQATVQWLFNFMAAGGNPNLQIMPRINISALGLTNLLDLAITLGLPEELFKPLRLLLHDDLEEYLFTRKTRAQLLKGNAHVLRTLAVLERAGYTDLPACHFDSETIETDFNPLKCMSIDRICRADKHVGDLINWSNDGTLCIHNIRLEALVYNPSMKQPFFCAPHDTVIISTFLNRSGTLLATASHDGTAKVWKIPSEQRTPDNWETPKRHPLYSLSHKQNAEGLISQSDTVFNTAISPHEKFIATASKNGTAKIWDAQSGSYIRTLVQKDKHPFYTIAFNPDETLVATFSDCLQVWNIRTGECICEIPHAERFQRPKHMIFSPDGKHVALASNDSNSIFSLNLQKCFFSKQHDYESSKLKISFNPDASTLFYETEEARYQLDIPLFEQCTATTRFLIHALWSKRQDETHKVKIDSSLESALEAIPDHLKKHLFE